MPAQIKVIKRDGTEVLFDDSRVICLTVFDLLAVHRQAPAQCIDFIIDY